MRNIIILVASLLFTIALFSQKRVHGRVFYEDNKPFPAVNVYWQGTKTSTVTDANGHFIIPFSKTSDTLVFSYLGFKTVSLKITSPTELVQQMEFDNSLDEITINSVRKSLQRTSLAAANMQHVSSKELLKAACCNLSESFETNPSIDVNFSDAVSGTKQIRMLGLTSPYISMTEENILTMRTASQYFGLSFIPGTWIESLQITKGAGSVVNGYESISGQINYEYIKPANDIPVFVNAYGSTDSRFELNTHFNKRISNNWSSSLFVHGNARVAKNDMNADGFLDNPIGKQINILNRWQYTNNEKGWVSFVNLHYMKDEKQMGQTNFDPTKDKNTTNSWGSEINTNKADVSAKLGYVFPHMPWKSIGLQTAVNYHNQESYFGLRDYSITQKSVFSNLIYNSIIGNTNHKFATGANLTYDNLTEFVNLTDMSRKDNSVGAFAEYTYGGDSPLSFVLGGRVDYHNKMGLFATPRFHLKYKPFEKTTFRISAGSGRRAANIFTENQQLFASSRLFKIENAGGKFYGLDPEIAYNYGFSFIQGFKLFNRSAEFVIDFYRTDFKNQVVVDVDNSAQEVLFYNLKKQSYANSLQIEFNFEPVKNLNIRTSYKFYDVKTDFTKGLMEKAMQAKDRFFANIGYETILKENKQWKFDFTYNWIGTQRLPTTQANPEQYRLTDYAASFSTANVQVTKVFSKRFELYLGGENITNYTQKNPILASDAPFGNYFDSSMVYAPIFGAMYYAGLRFKVL